MRNMLPDHAPAPRNVCRTAYANPVLPVSTAAHADLPDLTSGINPRP